jgi:hypothetical protein
MKRLAPYEYFNDNLVDFYLKFMLLEKTVIPSRPKDYSSNMMMMTMMKRKNQSDNDAVSSPQNKKKTAKSKKHPSEIDSSSQEDDDGDDDDDVGGRGGGRGGGGAPLISLESLSDEKIGQVHIFSSHFYGQLTDFSGVKRINAANHVSVQKWTKDFDLFSKRWKGQHLEDDNYISTYL